MAKQNNKPRMFALYRDEDESGISGTGRVAEGIEFSTGQCALAWITPFWSVAVYPNMRMIEEVHGHGGKTRIVFEDEKPPILVTHWDEELGGLVPGPAHPPVGMCGHRQLRHGSKSLGGDLPDEMTLTCNLPAGHEDAHYFGGPRG